MEADTDDYKRFPSRPIEAGPRPDRFRAAPLDLDREQVAGQALIEPLSVSETTAFLVITDGEVVYERYLNGDSRDSIQTSFSVAKPLRRPWSALRSQKAP